MTRSVSSPPSLSSSEKSATACPPCRSAQRLRLSIAFAAIILASSSIAPANAGCTICPNPDDAITKPDFPIDLKTPFSLATCGDLQAVVGYIDESTDDCRGVRTLGGLCGCPKIQGACSLCPSPSSLVNADHVLQTIPSFLQDAPSELKRTCGLVDSSLQQFEQTSDECKSIAQSVPDCACSGGGGGGGIDPGATAAPTPTGMPTGGGNNTVVDGDDSADTDTSSDTISTEKCLLCSGIGKVRFPDKVIELEGIEIPAETCGELETLTALLDVETEECGLSQLLSGYCGCPMRQNSCSLCPGGQSVPYPDKILEWITNDVVEAYSSAGSRQDSSLAYSNEQVSCALFDSFLQSGVDQDSTVCFANQLRRDACGCEPNPRLTALAASQILSGVLSFFGSSFIIFDILRDPKKRVKTYGQLMLGISIFDWIGSINYVFSSFFMPEEQDLFNSSGTEATCKVNGAMLQLSYASLWYNFALAVHFWLIVTKSWSEDRLRLYRRCCHAVIIPLSLGLALGGIPFYQPLFNICYVLGPPQEKTWLPATFLYFVPCTICILGATVATSATFLSVYKLDRASQRWRLQSQSNSMTNQVFWQSLWYLMAFYVPFPLLFSSFFVDMTEATYPLFVIVTLCSPLQGFLNFLIHFRRSLSSGQCFTCSWCQSRVQQIVSQTSSNQTKQQLGSTCNAIDGVPNASLRYGSHGTAQTSKMGDSCYQRSFDLQCSDISSSAVPSSQAETQEACIPPAVASVTAAPAATGTRLAHCNFAGRVFESYASSVSSTAQIEDPEAAATIAQATPVETLQEHSPTVVSQAEQMPSTSAPGHDVFADS